MKEVGGSESRIADDYDEVNSHDVLPAMISREVPRVLRRKTEKII